MVKKVLVLKGGLSAEREVSLVSAEGVEQALRKLGYEVVAHDWKIPDALLKVIKEFKSDIIVFSDSDAGGITAIKDMDDLFPEKEFYVAQLEREDPGDPCNSVEDIKRAIDGAVTSTEFLLRVNGLLNRT